MVARVWGSRAALTLILLVGRAAAADLDAPRDFDAGPGASPRYFPRSDGVERRPAYGSSLARVSPAGCIPRRVAVPTNAPDDPSYVGSSYGLSHPSYYGFTPPPGVDDPYGRSSRPYCP